MTHQEWLALLGPVLTALVTVAALLISAIGTGLVKRVTAYLDRKGQAEASKMITDANARVQAAMNNEAGNIALEIGAGQLDITDLAAVAARAKLGENKIMAKLPDAIELLKPLAGAIAEGIAGKVPAIAVPTAIASGNAVLDGLVGIRRELQLKGAAA